MVDIQSAAAEIRQGIKKDTKKLQGKNIMSASATQGGHNNLTYNANSAEEIPNWNEGSRQIHTDRRIVSHLSGKLPKEVRS